MKLKPFISIELIDYLKKLFPNKLPLKRGTTPEQISFLQGQQSVIARMEFLYEDDNPDEI